MSQLAAATSLLQRIENMPEDPSLDEILKSFDFIEEVVNDHVFVRIDNFQYKGKIIIPDKNKRQPTKGLVVAVAQPNSLNLKIGDRVLFSQFAGYLLKFEDTPICRCLGCNEILGRLKPNAPVLSVEGA